MPIDLFENPRLIFEPNFTPYQCSVLGVCIGDLESVLSDWEVETNDHGWNHVEGGVGFKVREGKVYQIKLPVTFLEMLKVKRIEDFCQYLGHWEETRHITYRSRLMHCGYLWSRGIIMWWQILPKVEPTSLVLFDPLLGVPKDSVNVSYTLENAVERHLEAPNTFEIPSKERRESLKIGDLVKLMFRIQIDDNSFVERMWVSVTEVKPEIYVGSLDNDPYCTNEIRSGMRVEFHADHIIQIWVPKC